MFEKASVVNRSDVKSSYLPRAVKLQYLIRSLYFNRPPPPPLPNFNFNEDANAAADQKKAAAATAALFDAINKGGEITSGLKKVSDDQKTHKNPELRGNYILK